MYPDYRPITWEELLAMRDRIVGRDIEYTMMEGKYRGPIAAFNMTPDLCSFYFEWQAIMLEPDTWWILTKSKNAPGQVIIEIPKASHPQIYLWETDEITIEGPNYNLLEPYRIYLDPTKSLDYTIVRPS